jgi:hypothetical protein
MGNTHHIQQIAPNRTRGGVAILVRRPFMGVVRQKHESLEEKCYTFLHLLEVSFQIHSVNFPDESFRDQLLYFCIQSGGKMWCGYDNFIAVVRDFAPYLEDALFYVNDEIGYCGFVDEFLLENGSLYHRRVAESGYGSIDDYLHEQS